MNKIDTFDPLDYDSLSDAVADALLRCEPIQLDEVNCFTGPGIYALFYHGPFPAYSLLASHERDKPGTWPIYVGKAAPSTRKGKDLTPDNFEGTGLYTRVKDHRNSIEQSQNLAVADFTVKVLILSYIWVPMAESAMIGRFKPLWNTTIDGFGNHDPGRGRRNGVRSMWDTLHPGRSWAHKYPERAESKSDVEHIAEQFLRSSMN